MKNIYISLVAFILVFCCLEQNAKAQCATGTISGPTVNSAIGTGTSSDPAQCPVTIDFCYDLTGYSEAGTNWVHGVYVPWGTIPSGATIVAGATGAQPTDQTGDTKNWVFVNATNAQAQGLPGPGFYVFDGSGTPGGNFGDNGTGDAPATFPSLAPFCFTATVPCTTEGNYTPTVGVSADGQTGSWTDASCPLSTDDNNTLAPVYYFEDCTEPAAPASVPTTTVTINEGDDISAITLSANCAACPAPPASTPSLTTSTSNPMTVTTNPFGAPAFGMVISPADLPQPPYTDCVLTGATISYAAYGIVPPTDVNCPNPNNDDVFQLDIYDNADNVIYFDPSGGASPSRVISNVNILTALPTWTPADGINLYIQQNNYLDPTVPCDIAEPFSWDVSSIIGTVTLTYNCPAQPAPSVVQTWYDASTGGSSITTGGSIPATSIPGVDPNTAGTYTVYTDCVCDGCPSSTRTAASLIVQAVCDLATTGGSTTLCVYTGGAPSSFDLSTTVTQYSTDPTHLGVAWVEICLDSNAPWTPADGNPTTHPGYTGFITPDGSVAHDAGPAAGYFGCTTVQFVPVAYTNYDIVLGYTLDPACIGTPYTVTFPGADDIVADATGSITCDPADPGTAIFNFIAVDGGEVGLTAPFSASVTLGTATITTVDASIGDFEVQMSDPDVNNAAVIGSATVEFLDGNGCLVATFNLTFDAIADCGYSPCSSSEIAVSSTALCSDESYSVTLPSCTVLAGGLPDFGVAYDLDPSTVPTVTEFYDGLTGGVSDPGDISFYGDVSAGCDATSLQNLVGWGNITCAPYQIAMYVFPIDAVTNNIDVTCAPSAPVVVTIYPDPANFALGITASTGCGVAPIITDSTCPTLAAGFGWANAGPVAGCSTDAGTTNDPVSDTYSWTQTIPVWNAAAPVSCQITDQSGSETVAGCEDAAQCVIPCNADNGNWTTP